MLQNGWRYWCHKTSANQTFCLSKQAKLKFSLKVEVEVWRGCFCNSMISIIQFCLNFHFQVISKNTYEAHGICHKYVKIIFSSKLKFKICGKKHDCPKKHANKKGTASQLITPEKRGQGKRNESDNICVRAA